MNELNYTMNELKYSHYCEMKSTLSLNSSHSRVEFQKLRSLSPSVLDVATKNINYFLIYQVKENLFLISSLFRDKGQLMC